MAIGRKTHVLQVIVTVVFLISVTILVFDNVVSYLSY